MAHILERIIKGKPVTYTDNEIIEGCCTNLIGSMWVFQKTLSEDESSTKEIVEAWRDELVRIRSAIRTKFDL